MGVSYWMGRLQSQEIQKLDIIFYSTGCTKDNLKQKRPVDTGLFY